MVAAIDDSIVSNALQVFDSLPLGNEVQMQLIIPDRLL